MAFEEAVVTHGIEATCASLNGIEAKCASPRWRPSPEIDWHRNRYPRDIINPAGRNYVNRQRSPLSNAIIIIIIIIIYNAEASNHCKVVFKKKTHPWAGQSIFTCNTIRSLQARDNILYH